MTLRKVKKPKCKPRSLGWGSHRSWWEYRKERAGTDRTSGPSPWPLGSDWLILETHKGYSAILWSLLFSFGSLFKFCLTLKCYKWHLCGDLFHKSGLWSILLVALARNLAVISDPFFILRLALTCHFCSPKILPRGPVSIHGPIQVQVTAFSCRIPTSLDGSFVNKEQGTPSTLTQPAGHTVQWAVTPLSKIRKRCLFLWPDSALCQGSWILVPTSLPWQGDLVKWAPAYLYPEALLLGPLH